jgi:Animal haem peroxidase
MRRNAHDSGTHGVLRGADFSPRSRLFEGRFGRLFRSLPPAQFGLEDLDRLAAEMTAEPEFPDDPDARDPEENQGITAGYTYFGQFIDHDLTFDPASSLERQNDPDSLVDFRTPRFDLDSVYGRGPDDMPFLYRQDGTRMLLGRRLTGNDDDPNARDLPRNAPAPGEDARALLGDPRNDENVIVSQLHASVLRFHNRVADVMSGASFVDVQRMVRWHYQWAVLYDFLPTILDSAVYHAILPHVAKNTNVLQDPPQLLFYHPPRDSAFMPIEFSAAAYRFGHSMVRPFYRLNKKLPKPFLIFSIDTSGIENGDIVEAGESLAGFRAFPDGWAIDWRLFFPKTGTKPVLSGSRDRVQPAYKIDSSLVNPLGSLPGLDPAMLAKRNLRRGFQMGLPSGQVLAEAMAIHPIPDRALRVGKATEEDAGDNPLLTTIASAFAGNAPLWYYVLAEAQHSFKNDDTYIRLGPVGSRLVGETFVRLLLEDGQSFLRQAPKWKPFHQFQASNGEFRVSDLLEQARQATDTQA